MIGMDLLTIKGLPVVTAKEYLGEPEQWITLSLGEVYTRLRARGWDAKAEMSPEVLVASMRAGLLDKIPDFVPPPPGEGLNEAAVPRVPDDVPRSSYRCPKGHTWTAIGEYRWEANYQPFLRSEPLCPYCVIDFANILFPAERLG